MVGPTKGRWSRELAAGIFAVVALQVQGVGYIPVMELVDLPDFGPDEYDEIVDGEEDPFGTEHLGIEWCPKDCHVGLEDDGRLVAHAGWLTTDARMANGELIEVLGLGGVMLHRRYRGSGVGRLVVTGAMDRMRRQSAVIAMLFCRPERLRFYGDLGWFPITEPVTVGQPGGSIVMPLRTCWLPLTQGTILPVGAIEFPGLPF
jgi:GNAT superfamily N-acetyltransferase